MTGVVSGVRAATLVGGLTLKLLLTRGRILALLGVGTAVAVLMAVVARARESDLRSSLDRANGVSAEARIDQELLESSASLMADLGFILVVPIIALVFASATFSDLREDQTLVYLWLRPMNRLPMVLGAWLAALCVSLPLSLLPLGVAAIVANAGSALVWATLLAAAVGTVAYCAVFLLLGLLLKNSVVWGLGYILIWEGIIAGTGTFGERLALRGYTRSILSEVADVELALGTVSLSISILVAALVAVVAIALSAVRLQYSEVA